MNFNLHQMKLIMHQMKLIMHQMKFNLHQLKFNLHQMKLNLHQMKSNLHQMKLNLHQMKFNILLLFYFYFGTILNLYALMCVFVGLSICINFSTNVDVPIMLQKYLNGFCYKEKLFQEMHKLLFMIFSYWHLTGDNYFYSERIT